MDLLALGDIGRAKLSLVSDHHEQSEGARQLVATSSALNAVDHCEQGRDHCLHVTTGRRHERNLSLLMDSINFLAARSCLASNATRVTHDQRSK